MDASSQMFRLALWAALLAGGLVALGELLHARRVRRAGRLAFGPAGRPRRWTRLVPGVAVLAAAAVAWSLAVLWQLDGGTRVAREKAPAPKHLVVLLDVSPSMLIPDAGMDGTLTRMARARDVMSEVLERVPPGRVLVTMAAFYTGMQPLVRNCADREIIRNFFSLPLEYAFKSGKTDLIKAVNGVGHFAQDLPRRSATLVVLTDGDTIADKGLEPLPSAFAGALVLGVGDPARGTFIDGHQSRQDAATLSQLARRLSGRYADANRKPAPDDWLRQLAAIDPETGGSPMDLREVALALLVGGALALALCPMALEYAGASRAGARRAKVAAGSAEVTS